MAFVPTDQDQKDAQTRQFGDVLERFLDALQQAGLHVGPSERLHATWLAANQISGRQASDLRDLKYILAPLLARSKEDRRLFFLVYDQFVPDDPQRKPHPDINDDHLTEPDDDDDDEPENLPWWKNLGGHQLAIGLALLIAGALALWYYFSQSKTDVDPVITKTVKTNPEPTKPPPKKKVEEKKAPRSKFPALNKVYDAAERFGGAPTLRELGRVFAADSKN